MISPVAGICQEKCEKNGGFSHRREKEKSPLPRKLRRRREEQDIIENPRIINTGADS
jgi:hypothetical protein